MLAVETSQPLGLREAHFKAIGRDELILQARQPIGFSKSAKKKVPKKGFMRTKKRAKGGYARDKEVIKKFKITKGIAKEKKTGLETVELSKKKPKKKKNNKKH